MKNLLLSMTIALFISLFPFCEVTSALPSENDYGVQQKSDWELVGIITPMSQYGEKKQFKLYYKTIGVKSFYQVRDYLEVVGTVTGYTVIFGDFSLRGDKYNAKFSAGYIDYYFNLS